MKLENGMLDIRKCVMFDESKKKCTGLKELYCLSGSCSFFKTKEQAKADELYREKRLGKLSKGKGVNDHEV